MAERGGRARPGWRRWLAVVGAALAVSGCGLLGGDDDGVQALGAEEVGPDPFVDGAGSAASGELVAVSEVAEAAETQLVETLGEEVDPEQVTAARQTAVMEAAEAQGLDVIRPTSPVGVGLYGGSGENVCDVAAMVAFFQADPEAAAAWAEVLSIQVADIGSYLSGLTPGYLLDSLEVVNHGYADGAAKPFKAELEAGTAVLADGDGVPRVRCRCGNPLLATRFDLDGVTVGIDDFADEVIDANLSSEVVADYADPSGALGPPDWTEREIPGTAASLGTATAECEFWITVAFVDNEMVNGPGDDLRVVEIGETEPTDVYVGTSADDLTLVGQIEGGDKSIDITPAVPEGDTATVVRLCDVPDVDISAIPGADIDAVAALSSRSR